MKPRFRALWPLGAALGLVLPVWLVDLHFIHTESTPIGCGAHTVTRQT